MLTAARQSLVNLVAILALFSVVSAAVALPWTLGAIRRLSPMVRRLSERGAAFWALANAQRVSVSLKPAQFVTAPEDQLLRQAWADSFRAAKGTTARRELIGVIKARSHFTDQTGRPNGEELVDWLESAVTPADHSRRQLSQNG
jgi:hypothetical protein